MNIELIIIGFIAAITPGPDILLVIQTTINRSLKSGLGVLLGILTGNAVIISILFFGFASLGENIYFQLTVSFLGGFYLLYVAREIFIHRKDEIRQSNVKAKNLYLKGLYVNLSNPKAIIFFGAILSPFVDKNALVLSLFSLFIGIIGAFVLAIVLTDIFRKNLLTKKATLIVNTLSATIFFIFSIELLRFAVHKAIERFS